MKKIYINPGHSDQDPGAVGFETERRLNVAVARYMAEYLPADYVCETRMSPGTMLTLAEVCSDANSWGADLFLSLHTNASVNPAANGSECLIYSNAATVAREVSEDILEQMTLITGLRNRGIVERPGLYVLRRTAMPAVVVEMGFITNPSDADLMVNSPNLFALGIYRGVLKYYGFL